MRQLKMMCIKIVVIFILFANCSYAEDEYVKGIRKNDDVDFSIRCQKGPQKITVGNEAVYWFDFIYFKWDGKNLYRQTYSASANEPYYWRNNEVVEFLNQSYSETKVSVDVEKEITEVQGKKQVRIEVYLDASKSEPMVLILSGSYISTFAKWKIFKTEGGLATMTEETSTFEEGKLSSSESDQWSKCRLMGRDGRDFWF